MYYLSTTMLAEEHGISAGEMFTRLKDMGYLYRDRDNWVLTELGKKNGGQIRKSSDFGTYIVWPENLQINSFTRQRTLINATELGREFGITSKKMNLILSELGWIEKTVDGWRITNLGKIQGAVEREHDISGNIFVLWQDSVLKNKILVDTFSNTNQSSSQKSKIPIESTTIKSSEDFRDLHPCPYRTKDGHRVRSRGELIIDDTLYYYNLAHAYERKVPIDEVLYSDFFIPKYNVYIEFWGLERDNVYVERKKKKIQLYKKYSLNLIELTDDDILNIDDSLPRKLLNFKIKIE